MKIGAVAKLDKRNKAASTKKKKKKKKKMKLYQKIGASLPFLQFMASLEKSGSRILDA